LVCVLTAAAYLTSLVKKARGAVKVTTATLMMDAPYFRYLLFEIMSSHIASTCTATNYLHD
jgi:hypothetical protein